MNKGGEEGQANANSSLTFCSQRFTLHYKVWAHNRNELWLQLIAHKQNDR